MGVIGESLARHISKHADPMISANAQDYCGFGIDAEGIADAEEMIEQGMDPVHVPYACVQNLTSYFAEGISVLKEMQAYYDIAASAEEEYIPGGPPISPLTASYFTSWAFFDLRFGPDQETVGTCLLDVIRHLNIGLAMAAKLEIMQESRMGIYEHIGFNSDKIILQELITEEKHLCHVPAGYSGKTGQLWLVRFLPPVNDSFDYGVVFNTPYILTGETKQNWLSFIKRTLSGAGQQVSNYHEFMKYGLSVNYWNEYIFLSYANHQKDAIFLAGLPDIQCSLPHGRCQ